MNKEREAIFLILGVAGAIIITWPIIQGYVPRIEEEKYTELFILGSDHGAYNYPYEITTGETYGIYIDIVNHRKASEFYELRFKVRDSFEDSPDTLKGDPSTQEPIYTYPIMLEDEKTWEKAFVFSFPEINKTQVGYSIPEIKIGEKTITIDKTIITDLTASGDLTIYFELWRLDKTSSNFLFDNRFVELWLRISTEE